MIVPSKLLTHTYSSTLFLLYPIALMLLAIRLLATFPTRLVSARHPAPIRTRPRGSAKKVNMLETPPHGHAEQSPTIPESSLPDTFDWSDVDGVRSPGICACTVA